MHPKISIALASYNGENYIEKQINSLLSQDYENIEIIISDDCSSDNTWQIINEFSKNDSRISLMPRKKNQGHVKNFYRALRSCTGDYLAPCDQDDIWHPNKLSRLLNQIGDASLIYCNSRFINENEVYLKKNISDTLIMLSGCDPRQFLFGNSVSGHAMLFKKEILDHNLNFNLDSLPYIDWMIAFLASKEGGIKYLDEPLVDWRQHKNSATSHSRNVTKESRIQILKDDEACLQAFSEIPGIHQNLAIEGLEKFRKWKNSYFDFSMFFFVLQHGHLTHAARKNGIPALKYLAGQKLKKLLRPNYY